MSAAIAKEGQLVTYRIITGDATQPVGSGPRIIVHVVNDRHAWAAGFVLAISHRWNAPEREYLGRKPELGTVQLVEVEPELYVANMCAQHGFPTRERPVALDYDALGRCLDAVADLANKLHASVHGPRFGAGIAGGRWEMIEALITQRVVARGVSMTIYDLQAPKKELP